MQINREVKGLIVVSSTEVMWRPLSNLKNGVFFWPTHMRGNKRFCCDW